ncbi:hypothetical protein EYF80_037544 [Liparis tanakae]|uniref:Uncharacterized protein n=1 Tax=Liparis tanakae TaxID=230148 RepID=A0A4Z2GG27_9TELE|nr:hypothetical protein EYF80_037544 [Liparis tanakae]
MAGAASYVTVAQTASHHRDSQWHPLLVGETLCVASLDDRTAFPTQCYLVSSTSIQPTVCSYTCTFRRSRCRVELCCGSTPALQSYPV